MMGLYNLTLDEVREVYPRPVINPAIPIAGLETLALRFYDEFGQREIGFETPDLFVKKLNNKLSILAPNYNRKLAAQFIDFDPFMTEYIEDFNRADSDKHIKDSEDYNERTVYVGDITENNTINTGTNVTEDNTRTVEEVAVGKKLSGSVESEATNTAHDAESSQTVDMTGKEVLDEDTTGNETFAQTETTDRDWTENTDREYSEHEEYDGQGTQVDTTDTTTTDSQTGRDWTEQGSNQGHNLDVHSDTPQAMLFNEPNHYYGTGRAHDYGEVVTDEEGNESYSHYPETEPSTLDTGSYEINGGDTPWFNYASDANNHTEHSSYSKSGTETYSRGGTSNSSLNRQTTDSHTRDTNGTETIDKEGTEDITVETDSTKNTTGTVDSTKDTTQNTQTDGTESSLDSTARNLHQAGSEDTANLNKQVTTGGVVSGSNTETSGNGYTKTKYDTDKRRDVDTKRKEQTSESSSGVTKGRRMRSPSELLKQYRETLDFNADFWLFGQLEVLFMDVY